MNQMVEDVKYFFYESQMIKNLFGKESRHCVKWTH